MIGTERLEADVLVNRQGAFSESLGGGEPILSAVGLDNVPLSCPLYVFCGSRRAPRR
jgi:hypothetical protein